jgi:hypothetical protein
MGILDDAIRDHLELKRKGGTQESDLQRLEDEAFGPPSRPGDAPGAVATAERPEGLTPETGDEPLEPQTGESDAPAPEASGPPEAAAPPPGATGSAPQAEASAERSEPEVGAEPEGGVVFHDFAAEEGLVGPRADAAPAPPVEQEQVPEVEEAEPSEPRTPAPEPADEASLDDTQPHDVEAGFGAAQERPESPPADPVEANEIELDDDLELHLDEEDLETSGSDKQAEPETGGGEAPGGPELTVVEEEEVVEEDVEVVEGEVEEPREDSPEDADEEDVLEETPDFLRETPEHDRLWFEQKPPKDFDFDE